MQGRSTQINADDFTSLDQMNAILFNKQAESTRNKEADFRQNQEISHSNFDRNNTDTKILLLLTT